MPSIEDFKFDPTRNKRDSKVSMRAAIAAQRGTTLSERQALAALAEAEAETAKGKVDGVGEVHVSSATSPMLPPGGEEITDIKHWTGEDELGDEPLVVSKPTDRFHTELIDVDALPESPDYEDETDEDETDEEWEQTIADRALREVPMPGGKVPEPGTVNTDVAETSGMRIERERHLAEHHRRLADRSMTQRGLELEEAPRDYTGESDSDDCEESEPHEPTLPQLIAQLSALKKAGGVLFTPSDNMRPLWSGEMPRLGDRVKMRNPVSGVVETYVCTESGFNQQMNREPQIKAVWERMP